jgi:hypothetical protein
MDVKKLTILNHLSLYAFSSIQKMMRRAASLVALASLFYALHLRSGQESDEAEASKAKSLSHFNRALIVT